MNRKCNSCSWIFITLAFTLISFSKAYSQDMLAKSVVLTHPGDGISITENMPVLTWEALEGFSYEVWIDGLRMESDLNENWYIPFPLSYGEHHWKVLASRDQQKISSKMGVFVIDGAPLSPLPPNGILLRNNWKVLSSLLAGKNGASISKKIADLTGWKSTSIPATVLSVMVRNGLYPNPYVGTNNMEIPDLSDEFNDKYDLIQYSHIAGKNPWLDPYWYRTTFEVPEAYSGKKIWLTLGEINYRAEVWFNGELLADTAEVVGMERYFRFDISALARLEGQNALAIAIYPPDHPGIPADAPLTPLAAPGLNMANGMISKDYTKWDVLGWDWIPAVRDRDMGITEDVFIHATDLIELDNLYVTSDLPLPHTAFADISISADLINHSSQSMAGTIKTTISRNNQDIVLENPFEVGPNDTLELFMNQESMPQLHIKNPDLWWPLGYGEPALYTLSLEAISQNEKAAKEIHFGIREVETYMGANERVYKVNGEDIYIKGGNWVLDMMLNWTAARYEQEIRLTKHANMNMLRVWGPTGAPPESFYEAADRNGILVWQDFLNDFWGTFKNTPGMSPNESLFEKASIQMVKRYRNHPSLIIWCGGNEGPNPREALLLNRVLPQHDGRDSKHYLKISNGDGLHGGGPYHTILPEAYFDEPKLTGFSSEIGPSGVPTFESVKRFMPDLGKTWAPGRFPIDGVWAYHDAINFPGGDKRKFSHYDDIVRNFYGAPDSTLAGIEDYLEKCQLLNYDVYRACLEAINSQLWDNSSGILLWKSNSSWPSMVWQTYDWYLQCHAGYYGVKKSAAPQSVQFNRSSHKIEVVNASLEEFTNTRVNAVLYDKNLSKIWEARVSLTLDKNSVYTLNEVVPLTESVCYLKLELESQNGLPMEENFYWLSTKNDFKSFEQIPEPVIAVAAEDKTVGNTYKSYSVSISNQGESIALMTQFKIIDPESGLEILPSYWSDNYLSLMPGGQKEVEVRLEKANLPEKVVLTYKAFNMNSTTTVILN